MKFILIIGTFEAVFLILLLLTKRNKQPPDLFLGIIFFLYALSIGSTYLELYNIDNGYPFPAFLNFSWLFLFLHGPALWFYIKSLSVEKFTFKAVYFLHLRPFIAFSIGQYFEYFQLPADERILISETESFMETVFYKIGVIGIGVSTFSYNIWDLNLKKKGASCSILSRLCDEKIQWKQYYFLTSSTPGKMNGNFALL